MPSTYYQIELSARTLTALLVALAVLMVLAFALGYGAAWSVLAAGDQPAAGPPERPPVLPTAVPPTPTRIAAGVPTVLPEVVSTAVPTLPQPTAAPAPPLEPSPQATTTPAPAPTAVPLEEPAGFWVQVAAAGNRRVAADTGKKLEKQGFPPDHQRVLAGTAANGRPVWKVQVGPLPDRESANRVVQRLKAAGFRDAWIVLP
jgi:cell division septation protein DedD